MTEVGSQLTPDQTRIIYLLLDGRSEEGIARTLEMGVSTVRRRVRAAMAELGVGSRVTLGAVALLLGLVSEPPAVRAALDRNSHRAGKVGKGQRRITKRG